MLHARQRGARLVDVTPAVVAVHQDHDYGHIPGLAAESADGDFPSHATEEITRNLALAGGHSRLFTVYDATEVLTREGKLVSTLRPTLIWRRLKASLRRLIARAPPRIAELLRPARH
jgi:hypothetical protein